jgi:hypothetical protein
MENKLYSDSPLIIAGDKLFQDGYFKEALHKFESFLQEFPNGRRFVLGRIAITSLKLSRFEDAKNQVKEAIELNPNREKEYFPILAECYGGLEEYEKLEEYCNRYLTKYGASEDVISILNKILPSPEYDILLRTNDLEYNNQHCADAFLRLSNKSFKVGDYDSAEYYASLRIKYKDQHATAGYFMLGSAYKETKEYYKCAPLLYKMKADITSGQSGSAVYTFLLDIYKESECFKLSVFSESNFKLASLSEIVEKVKEEMKVEKLKSLFATYQPVLDLAKYFHLEQRLQLASA